MAGNISAAPAVVVGKCCSRGVSVVSRRRRPTRTTKPTHSRLCAKAKMLQHSLQLLTVRETAEVLRQSEWSVRQKIGRGEIPAIRVGVGPRAPLRVLRSELERFLFTPPPKPPESGATSPIAGSPRDGLEGEPA